MSQLLMFKTAAEIDDIPDQLPKKDIYFRSRVLHNFRDNFPMTALGAVAPIVPTIFAKPESKIANTPFRKTMKQGAIGFGIANAANLGYSAYKAHKDYKKDKQRYAEAVRQYKAERRESDDNGN